MKIMKSIGTVITYIVYTLVMLYVGAAAGNGITDSVAADYRFLTGTEVKSLVLIDRKDSVLIEFQNLEDGDAVRILTNLTADRYVILKD